MFWNVLAKPIPLILSGRLPFSSFISPSTFNLIVPSVGLYTPVKRLKNVVLPAPFGPINPTNSPSFNSKETFDTAANPPKFFVNLSTSNRLMKLPPYLYVQIIYSQCYQI